MLTSAGNIWRWCIAIQNCCRVGEGILSGSGHCRMNTILGDQMHLIKSLLEVDRQWTTCHLAMEVGISQITVFHSIKDMSRMQRIASFGSHTTLPKTKSGKSLLTSIWTGTTTKGMHSYAVSLPLTKPGCRHTSLN
jgi:hypothetical protein